MASHRHIPGLDGLRAIACLAVFGVHLQQQAKLGGSAGPFDVALLLKNGNTGVCLFFMLSGFLLSLPFWMPDARREDESRGLRWAGGFALRRIGRIVPAYYLCLFALVALGAGEGGRDVIMHAFFVHNLSETTIYSINEPFWTLAVQAQFYVVFAVLMMLLSPLLKNRAAMGLLLAMGAAGAFLGHMAVMKRFDPPAGDYVLSHSILAHLPHFLLGMLAALLFAATLKTDESGQIKRSGLCDLFFWLALVGIVIILGIPAQDAQWRVPSGAGVNSGVINDDPMLGRYNFPYVPVLIAVLIMTAPRALITTKVLQLRPLQSIGVISYGLYVYHLPCLSLVNRLMAKVNMPVEKHWIFFALTGLSLSLVVALISYAFIERPLMRWSKRKTRGTANSQPAQD